MFMYSDEEIGIMKTNISVHLRGRPLWQNNENMSGCRNLNLRNLKICHQEVLFAALIRKDKILSADQQKLSNYLLSISSNLSGILSSWRG